MKASKIILLSLASSAFLLAAPPSSGDMERQVQPPREVDKGVNNTIPSIPQETFKEQMVVKDDSQKIEVKGFTFSGIKHISEEKLLSRIQSYAGKSYSFSELQKLTSLITKAYREEGYFVARAYIPKQEMKNGIVEIAIIEGNYGEFKLTNSSLVNNERVQGMLDDVKSYNIVSVDTLERAMLIINDTPGVQVTGADVMPGKKVGTSDFAVKTEATNPYSAYILGDNYGSKYTGRYRVNLGFTANSPLGYGDKLSLNGLVSTTGDLKNGRVSYGFPLMDNGLRGELSASQTTYSLADEYEALDAIGTSKTLEASLYYPIFRTREQSLFATLSYAHKNMNDEVGSTATDSKKEADVASASLRFEKSCQLLGVASTTMAYVTLTYGTLDVKDAASLALDASGAQTDGSYAKISGVLEKGFQLSPEYELATSLRFQKALNNKNLDGSEDFSLGGAYGVRAFPDGEHSAENGYLIGAELLYTLPAYEGINHKVSVFADTGYAKMENPLASSEDRHLSDIGLGYQAYYKEFFTKLQVAHVIGSEKVTSETPSHDTKLLVQFGWMY